MTCGISSMMIGENCEGIKWSANRSRIGKDSLFSTNCSAKATGPVKKKSLEGLKWPSRMLDHYHIGLLLLCPLNLEQLQQELKLSSMNPLWDFKLVLWKSGESVCGGLLLQMKFKIWPPLGTFELIIFMICVLFCLSIWCAVSLWHISHLHQVSMKMRACVLIRLPVEIKGKQKHMKKWSILNVNYKDSRNDLINTGVQ